MAVRTLSDAVGNLYASTWQKMRSDAIDNIYDATPFFFWLRDRGKLKKVTGSKRIEETLMYAQNGNVSWLQKGDAVSLNDFEHLTTATYDWKYLVASMVRFGVEEQQNQGKYQILDLVKCRLENTRAALADDLETKTFADAATGNEIDGLQHLVQDDPTSSTTVGGINQSTYSWWQNKTKNMTGLSFASNGVAEMRTILNNCMQNRGSDRPDIIVSGQTPYEYYEDSVLEHLRINNTKLGDKGFDNITFKGIPMVWSPSCANTRMYFLNTNYLYLVYDPTLYFSMTNWKEIPDQPNDFAAQIVSAVTLVTNRRRTQGVMYNIDTA